MSDKTNPPGRRSVRFSRIASLAAVLTLSLTLVAGADTKRPRAEEARPVATAVVAAPSEAAADYTNENIGCGCAEPCYAAN
ncbi:MAG: hypothetical protein ACHQPI_06060 [Thermoanaerobaculia bacterium]